MSSKNVASLETVSLGMRLEKDLKLRSPQITQEAPNIMTSVLEETGPDVERGEAACRQRQRLGDAAAAQGLWQDPEAGRGGRDPPESLQQECCPVSTRMWAAGRQTRRE